MLLSQKYPSSPSQKNRYPKNAYPSHPKTNPGAKRPSLSDRRRLLHILHILRVHVVLAREAHLGREGAVRDPLAGGAGVGLLEHAVDLLEREALGLGDEDVGVHEADGAEGAPHEKHLRAQVPFIGTDHVRCDDGDDLEGWWSGRADLGRGFGGFMTYAVPEPVGGGGEGHAAGADGEGEDLADQHPRARAPGRGEEEDVDADEGDHHVDGRAGGGSRGGADDGDDELADHHPCGAADEERPTAEALDCPEGDGRGAHVDEGGNKGDKKGILNGAELLEKGGAEVENKVDAGPLLHHLQRGAENGATQVAARLRQAAFEAVGPGTEVAVLGDDLHFVFVVGHDLGDFFLDELRVPRLSTEPGQDIYRPVDFAFLDEIARGFREEEQADPENQGPEQLDGDGDPV